MSIKQKRRLIYLLVGILFLVAALMDYFDTKLGADGKFVRNPWGKGSQEIELYLSAEDVIEQQPYTVVIEEVKLTEKECLALLNLAKEEVDETFLQENRSLNEVISAVNVQNSYVEGQVSADWTFSDYKWIDPAGEIIQDQIPIEGVPLLATVELCCQNVKEEYSFGFVLYPRPQNQEEALLHRISSYFEEQNEEEGAEEFVLPQELDGITLEWTKPKEHLAVKLLFIALIIRIAFPFVEREEKRKKKEEKEKQMLLAYPDIVSKLTILVGCGMSIKQAWNRISASYYDKRQKNTIKESVAYEEMYQTKRALDEGESERIAYQKFGERTGISSYQRLVRILLQSLQKGSKGMKELLERESYDAFEERKRLAKKLGEEASTKLVLPLVLMMSVVMVIVIAPAIIDFIR